MLRCKTNILIFANKLNIFSKKTYYSFFYFLENSICLLLTPKHRQRVVVIRTDAIGDYILFRNFLKPIFEKYGKVTLVGNLAYKDLALELDRQYIQEFIALDRKKFARNILYRFSFIRKLRVSSYDLLINPIYSRDRISEDIVRLIDAREKITSIGDVSNLPKNLKEKYDKNYTTLFPAKKEILFEFYRNLEFFQNLLSKDLSVDFFIKLECTQNIVKKFNLTLPYSVLFIGASTQYRKWCSDNFIKVGEFLHSTFQENIVICGGSEDYESGEYIKKQLEEKAIKCFNLCGKTSLLDLAKIINHGNFLISNETSAVHLSMAIHHPRTCVISNGNHIGRFSPYPPKISTGYYPIFHPLFYNSSYFTNHIGKISLLDINQITPHDVIQELLKFTDNQMCNTVK